MKSSKVIYVGDSSILNHLINSFKTNLDYYPSLTIGENNDLLEKNSNASISLETIEKYEFDFDYNNIPPLGIDILENLSEFESSTLSLLDDTDGWNFSFNERKNFYYDTIKFWISILKKDKPNIVIFVNEPKKFSTFILKNLCEKVFNIKLIIFNQKYFIEEKITHLELVNFEKEEKKNLNNIIKNISNKQNLFSYSKQNNKNLFLKKNRNPYFLSNSKLSQEEIKDFLNLKSRTYIRNFKFYEKNCEKIVPGEKYILFYENFYETKNQIIDRGIFDNTLILLKNISNVLPKNFKIYFLEKFENLNKLNMDEVHYGRSNYKNKKYFLNIKNIKNIKLISNKYDFNDIVKKSEGVCSISNDMIMNSYSLNKPTIIFGNSCFNFLENIFCVENFDELKKLLNTLDDKKSVNKKNLTTKDIKIINLKFLESKNLIKYF